MDRFNIEIVKWYLREVGVYKFDGVVFRDLRFISNRKD